MNESDCPKCGRGAEKVHASDCPYHPNNRQPPFQPGEEVLVRATVNHDNCSTGHIAVNLNVRVSDETLPVCFHVPLSDLRRIER